MLLIVYRSEEHTSELQSRGHLVCRLLLEKKKTPRSPGTQIPTTAQPQPHRYRLVVTASDLTSGRLRFLHTDADACGAAPEQLREVDAVRASTSVPFFLRPVTWKKDYGKSAWMVVC